MSIPASKVRSVCTSSETALVRASRKPVLEELTPAELKRNAARAKKLFDKWQDLSRTHARARGQKVGFGEADANTMLKAEIFGEALQSYEARLAKVGSAKGPAAKSAGSKTKKDRSAEQRATRAAVRKGMAVTEDLLNAPAKKKKAAAAKSVPAAAPQAASVEAAAPAKTVKPKKSKTPAFVSASVSSAPPTKVKVKGPAVTPSSQRKALTAAKQSRFVASGKTTRTLGHVVARGKRAQARRDSKG